MFGAGVFSLHRSKTSVNITPLSYNLFQKS
ncbi:Uncharacterised protein [Serratia marcescens]|nr:Uncharacterised protein [Serratia marcescens]